MKRFNKATAAAISGALTSLLVAYSDMPAEAVASLGTLATAVLVWIVPNAEN
jgi:hypothetical protein